VKVVIITQQIELSGAVGRMIAALLLGLAEIELEYRLERQMAGIAVAKTKGVYRGRLPGTLKGRPTRAMELKAKGLKVPEIARAMGLSVRTVLRYISACA
jgi:DNA invertase Pin-like site-specific DNA recombinase